MIHQATQYLHLMSSLTTPTDFYFRSFATEGVDGLADLCADASRCAVGPYDAMASLIIAPGDADTFCVDGAHARATLCLCNTPHTRVYVLLAVLLVSVVIAVLLTRQPTRKK